MELGGLVLAETMLDRIESRFGKLLEFPYSAPVYKYKPNLRRLVVADGLFLVFYRIEQDIIQVVHIRRAEQDLI
jgi:plasmid stabilization system protein ParE